MIVGSRLYVNLIEKRHAVWSREGAILPDSMILAVNVGKCIQAHYVLLVPVMFAVAFLMIFIAERPKSV